VVAVLHAPEDPANDGSRGRPAEHVLAIAAVDLRASSCSREFDAALAHLAVAICGKDGDHRYGGEHRADLVHECGVFAVGNLAGAALRHGHGAGDGCEWGKKVEGGDSGGKQQFSDQCCLSAA